MRMIRLLPALVLPLLLGADGAAPTLIQPIDCVLGKSCAIQNYVDIDPSPAARDYRCGTRSYDAHNGVDFRLTSLDQMERGVAVLAAADGVVLRMRDGVADISVKQAGAASVEGMMCGNGVVIRHEGGFESQYCHLAKGSIAVKPGQTIKAGGAIGRVGLSGNTEYPHLHFTLRKDGGIVEPFAYGAGAGQCGGGRNLFGGAALRQAYRAGEVLNAGFSTGPVSMEMALRHGATPPPRPSRDAPALVAFVQAIGLKAGDVRRLVVTMPGGALLGDNRAPALDRDKAQWLIFAGKKRPATGWPSGVYDARYTVSRDGRPVLTEEFRIKL